MRKIFIILMFLSGSVLAQTPSNSRPLLPNQPVLSQMTGNCYTHSGTDMLAGIYLKEKNVSSVNQPHPLLLGGILSHNIGRANISSGNTCDFFNDAKKFRDPVCSVQAFNRLVTDSGLSADTVKDHIGDLDSSMKELNEIFNKRILTVQDKVEAIGAAEKIIASTCHLNAVANLNDDKILALVDQSREVIRQLSPINTSTPMSTVRSLFSINPLTLINRAVGGAGLYTRVGRRSMNEILDVTYSALNKACLDNARAKRLPSVPRDFFTPSQRYTCRDEMYKTPRRSTAVIKEQLDFIDRQVRAGYPTGISVCSSVFYPKSPVVGGYRTMTGGCPPKTGGHAVTVTGVEYRNGKRFFKIRNSWGTGSCRGFEEARNICAQTGESGCPTRENSVDCKDGVYYMSDRYLGFGLYRHARLTVPRSR